MGGRHRRPAEPGTPARRIAQAAVVGAAVTAPLALGGIAQAAPSVAAAHDATWDSIAHCEATGNWSANTGNGFQGGLQVTQSTWNAFGGTAYAPTANHASRNDQIAVAKRVQAAQGWKAWPVCSKKAGVA